MPLAARWSVLRIESLYLSNHSHPFNGVALILISTERAAGNRTVSNGSPKLASYETVKPALIDTLERILSDRDRWPAPGSKMGGLRMVRSVPSVQ
jgi:hypothetical protein